MDIFLCLIVEYDGLHLTYMYLSSFAAVIRHQRRPLQRQPSVATSDDNASTNKSGSSDTQSAIQPSASTAAPHFEMAQSAMDVDCSEQVDSSITTAVNTPVVSQVAVATAVAVVGKYEAEVYASQLASAAAAFYGDSQFDPCAYSSSQYQYSQYM